VTVPASEWNFDSLHTPMTSDWAGLNARPATLASRKASTGSFDSFQSVRLQLQAPTPAEP
jgi:hypothetical protein